jgi:hypothetical protein
MKIKFLSKSGLTCILCLGFLISYLPVAAQTMSFPSSATWTGFTFNGWSQVSSTSWIAPTTPNVNSTQTISVNSGTWTVVSFQTTPYAANNPPGGGVWTVNDDKGDSYNYSISSSTQTITLNWANITTLTFQLTGGGVSGSNPNNVYDFGNVVYTVPTATPNTITTGNITGPFCAGAAVSVPFTANGTYNADNVFTAYLSDASGSFTNQVSIGTLTGTSSGNISATIPTGTATGENYYINVVSSDPGILGIPNFRNFTINALPTAAIFSLSPGNNDGNINGDAFCGGVNGALLFSVKVPGSNDNWNITFTYGAAAVSGTGSQNDDYSANTFSAGTYTINSLTDITTGCSAIASGLTGSVTINPNPLAYTVSGEGSYCIGGAGLPINLSGSQDGLTYILQENGSPTATTFLGTGNAFSFGDQTSTAGAYTTYSVVAKSSAGCVTQMNGSPAIYANPLPTVIITNPAPVCSPGTADLEAAAVTSGSDAGLIYSYYYDQAATQTIGTPIEVGAGTYYIVGTNSTTGCSSAPQPVTVTVNTASTTTSLSSSLNPSLYTQAVTFTATVSVNSPCVGTPTGTVTFYDGTSIIAGGSAIALDPSGSASVTISSLPIYTFAHGLDTITAVYSGSGNFLSSVSPALLQDVEQPVIFTGGGPLTAFTTCSGNPSAIQNFEVAGMNLPDNLVVTAPAGFEISEDGTNFSGSVSITVYEGRIGPVIIYVRLSSTATGSLSGNIACTSTGASEMDVAVSGTADAPTAVLSGNAEICSGGNTSLSISLSGTAPWSVTYTDGSTPVTQTGITVSPYTFAVSPTVPSTSYSITAMQDANCTGTGSGSATVTVDQPSVAGSISGAGTVCAGTNSTTLNLTGYTGSIQWDSSTDNINFYPISNATGASYTATNLSATTYYEAVVTSGVCSSATTSPVTINIDQPPTVGTISGAGAVCAGTNSTLLTLTGASGNIQWASSLDNTGFAGGLINNATGMSYTATNLSTTTYYAVIVTSGVCNSVHSPSVEVQVNPLPSATIGGSGSPVCVGGASPIITFTGSGATAPYTFTYSLTSGSNTTSGLIATGGSPSATIGVPTTMPGSSTYTLTSVTDASSTTCSQAISNQSQTATINPIPAATIAVNTTAVCQNGTSPVITFSGMGGTAPYTFTYTINSGTAQTISDLGTGSVTLGVPTGTATSYTYALTDVTDANGCTPQSVSGQSVSVTVNPLPVATINTASMVTAVSTGNTASVANEGTGASYSWTITGGAITAGSGTDMITYSAGTSGDVLLSVAVTSPVGCGPVSSGTLQVPITALACPKAEITVASAVCSSSTGNTASVAAVTGNKYVWTISNGTITAGSGTSSITYSAAASGNVLLSVSVTNASGQCSISSGTYKVCIIPLPIAAIIASPVVCSSSTANLAGVLYAGPGATYTWTISNGTITAGSGTPIIKYTAGSTGTVTLAVTVTNSTGCKASSGNKSITISAYPVATITASAAACAGSPGNTASVGSGGTGAHYAWSITGGCITAGSATNSVSYTAGASGTVTLAVTVTNASGCSTASTKKLVTIVGAPSAAITASASVCSVSTGNTASVVSAGTGGSYSWSITNGTITAGSGTDKITYTAGLSGDVILSVTVTNSTGCRASSGSKEIVITALPVATITTTGSVCSASTGNAASVASAGSGATYGWTITNGTITSGSGTAAIKYTAASTGSVTLAVTVTTSGGCKTASGNKTVTINAKTIPTFTSIPTLCTGATAPVLPAKSNNGISGSWNPSKVSTSATGKTTYTFTPAAGDCASAVEINVTVEKCTQEASITEGTLVTGTPQKTAATESEEKLEAVVYPNPSIIGFRLELKSSIKETVDILVIDLVGNPIYHTRGEATGSYLFGERFVKGMYFVEIIHQDGIRTLKIIKQ